MVDAAVLVVAVALAGVPAPHLQWRTLESNCCDIHYPIELESVARRLVPIADDAVKNASALMGSVPSERVQIVIHDVTDSPNGSSNSVPFDLVDLRAITPEEDSDLGLTDEYMRLLVQHEILHVVHLDTIHGIPWVVNLVLGKSWPPNIIQPRFVVEGIATYAETRFTGGGRLRSNLFLSQLRIAALANDLWSLDDLAAASRRPPGGSAAYVYGSVFMEFLSKKYGEKIWPIISNDYGGTVIPYAFQRSIEAATGTPLEDDYRALLDAIRAEAHAVRDRVQARGGPTHARRLTRVGGTVREVAFLNGLPVLSINPPNGPAGLYRVDGAMGGTPRLTPIVRTEDAADIDVVDGIVVLSQAELVDGWRTFHDLWRVQPDHSVERITRGARLHHPAHIAGTRDVIAEQRTGVDAALVRVNIDTGAITDVVRHADGVIDYSPATSPDGSRVVVSRWSPGGSRNLVELSLVDGAERALTHDGAQNLDPAYAPDGERVVFTSDRDGVLNVYAVDRASLDVRRIVDTLGTAQRPVVTPDGAAVIYVDNHMDGQDLYAAPYDWDHAPRAEPAPTAAPDVVPLTAPSTVADEPYNPLWTLVPHQWLPLLQQDSVGGPAVGAVVNGEDIAGRFALALQATYGFGIGRPRIISAFRFQDLYVPITAGFEWRTDRSDVFRRNDGLPELQQQTVVRGSLQGSIPILRRQRNSHTFTIGAQRELHIDETGFTSAPDARAPVYPPKTSLTAVTLDWSWANLQSGRDSPGFDRGSLAFVHFRHADPLWFSEQEITDFSVDVRTFEPVPGLPQHAIGAYASGGVSFGDPLVRQRYVLGGFEERDLVRDLIDGTRSGVGYLRGYPRNVSFGDAYALGTLEYHLPLLEIERGPGSLPLYLERLSLAPFADMGLAFEKAPNLSLLKGSVGVELRANITLGYYGYFIVRIGYARGLSRGGIDQPYVVMGVPY